MPVHKRGLFGGYGTRQKQIDAITEGKPRIKGALKKKAKKKTKKKSRRGM